MENLQQLIVKDLNEHMGLSVDTIVEMSNNIDDIKKFKILASIIKKEFGSLKGNYKKTPLEAPLTPLTPRSRPERSNKRRKSELTPQGSQGLQESQGDQGSQGSQGQIGQYRKQQGKIFSRVIRPPSDWRQNQRRKPQRIKPPPPSGEKQNQRRKTSKKITIVRI